MYRAVESTQRTKRDFKTREKKWENNNEKKQMNNVNPQIETTQTGKWQQRRVLRNRKKIRAFTSQTIERFPNEPKQQNLCSINQLMTIHKKQIKYEEEE